jgi:hypothetical protein
MCHPILAIAVPRKEKKPRSLLPGVLHHQFFTKDSGRKSHDLMKNLKKKKGKESFIKRKGKSKSLEHFMQFLGCHHRFC